MFRRFTPPRDLATKKEVDDLRKQFDAITGLTSSQTGRLQTIGASLEAQDKENQAVRAEIAALQGRLDVHGQAISTASSDLSSLKGQVKTLNDGAFALLDRSNKAAGDITNLAKKLDNLASALNTVAGRVGAVEKSWGEGGSTLKTVQTVLANTNSIVNDHTNKIGALRTELNTLKSKVDSGLSDLGTKVAQLKARADVAAAQLTSVNNQLKQLKATFERQTEIWKNFRNDWNALVGAWQVLLDDMATGGHDNTRPWVGDQNWWTGFYNAWKLYGPKITQDLSDAEGVAQYTADRLGPIA